MAGQAGFEPATLGFGVRCSSRWSYWPAFAHSRRSVDSGYLGFAMQRMRTTGRTELLYRKLVGLLLFVLRRRVVAPLASVARQRDQVSHYYNSRSLFIAPALLWVLAPSGRGRREAPGEGPLSARREFATRGSNNRPQKMRLRRRPSSGAEDCSDLSLIRERFCKVGLMRIDALGNSTPISSKKVLSGTGIAACPYAIHSDN